MRKHGLQRIAELGELELVGVKRIRTRALARLRVVELVRRRDDELTGRSQHAPHVPQELLPALHVLDNLKGDQQVERRIPEWKRLDRCAHEVQVRQPVILPRVRDGFLGSVHAQHEGSVFG